MTDDRAKPEDRPENRPEDKPEDNPETEPNPKPDPLILCVNAADFRQMPPFSKTTNGGIDFVRDVLFTLTRLNPHFYPRSLAETDESRKQVIPYCVFTWKCNTFTYLRGLKGGEARLHRKRSLGVGGHIEREDIEGDIVDPIVGFYAALAREIREEVSINTLIKKSCCLGIINDHETPVGRVHLGVCFGIELATPQISLNEAELEDCRWMSKADLLKRRGEFEGWSQIFIDNSCV